MRPYLLKYPALIMIFTFTMAGCSKSGNKQELTQEIPAIPVETLRPSVQDLNLIRTYSGTVEGTQQASVTSKMSERILKLNIRVGQHVQKGQTLAVLEMNGPQSQYFQTQAALKLKEKDLKRLQSLYKEGAIALQDLEGAETDCAVASANFQAARQAVIITAPISGEITELHVQLGDVASQSAAIAIIANTSRLDVKFNVDETDIHQISGGKEVKIYTNESGSNAVSGRISEVNRSASTDSRSFQVKATFSNLRGSYYKPGMFVRLDLVALRKNSVLAIPNAAIVHQGGEAGVYLVENGLAIKRKISTGITDGKNTEITAGLSQSDIVIVKGQTNLRDRAKVSITKTN